MILPPRFAVDANVLIYMIDMRDPEKRAVARRLVAPLLAAGCAILLQSLGEFFHAASRKRICPREEAREHVRDLMDLFPILHAQPADVEPAMAATIAGRFSYWDALMLATVASAGCTLLFSEDMADGATFGPVTVRNPFGPHGASPAFLSALDDT